jgi:3-hydroxyisobutyrate dehydrogenase-like beta-hydroxyacid dehydrogenase
MRVGLIGLGNVGEGMAHNLAIKGFAPVVRDIRPEPVAHIVSQGAVAKAGLATVQSRAQRLQDSAALLYAVSRNWDRADTTEPSRTSLAAVTR